MRKPQHTRAFEIVLSLMLAACSSKPRQITLPPLAERSQFDNPTEAGVRADAGDDGSTPQADAGFSKDSCANGLITATRIPPKVILVLDGSCSMSTDYPANGAASASRCTRNAKGRWSALRSALVGAQGVVPKLEKAVAFGLVVYGTEPRCPIPAQPIAAALGNAARIQAGFPETPPGMYTPTGPALDWVFDNLVTAVGPDQRAASQIVILATDGEPNSCGGGFGFGRSNETNYQPSIDAVKKGAIQGAVTYVISLADATGPFHDHLQALANLGNPAAKGGAELYEPASPDELAQTLDRLTLAAVSCEIALNGTILLDQACDGTVTLDGTELACNDPNGWMPIDERRIRLVGEACEKLRASNNPAVEAHFACTGFRPD